MNHHHDSFVAGAGGSLFGARLKETKDGSDQARKKKAKSY